MLEFSVYSYLNYVKKDKKMSPTLSRQHHDVTNITVAFITCKSFIIHEGSCSISKSLFMRPYHGVSPF